MLNLSLVESPKLRCYPSHQIPIVWNRYRPLIQKALDRGSNYDIADIYSGLCRAEMQLWTWGDDAALVTSLQSDGERYWCLLLALGGAKMEEWKCCLPFIEEWAKNKGCDELRIYGRRGWARLGFDIEYTKLVRKL